MKFYQSRQRNKESGFTLVEMIVSIALFTVVAVVAIGAFLKVINSNKKSQTLKTSINNINFALESMSREMRVGTNILCGAGVGLPTTATGCFIKLSGIGSSWTISFTSVKNPIGSTSCRLKFAYQFSDGTLKKAEQLASDQTCTAWGDFLPVVSSDMIFTAATIRALTLSNTQGFAQFHLAGYSGLKEKDRTYFDIQTTIAQRLPN